MTQLRVRAGATEYTVVAAMAGGIWPTDFSAWDDCGVETSFDSLVSLCAAELGQDEARTRAELEFLLFDAARSDRAASLVDDCNRRWT